MPWHFSTFYFVKKMVTRQLSLTHGSWHPTWHYDACAYPDGEIHADAPRFREICPSTNANCHNETTHPLYSQGHQTTPYGPFYDIGLSNSLTLLL